MLIDAIWDWNPWWDDASKIKNLIGLRREELTRMLPSLDDAKVTVISGVRRSGKTTLMYQMIAHLLEKGAEPKNILFLGLEDPAFVGRGLDDLLSEYRKEHGPEGKVYLFLDEIQSVGGWERVIRREIDVRKGTKVVVSGSSSSLLSGEHATLLTGRNLTYYLRPLTFRGFYSFVEGSEPPSVIRGEAAEKAGHMLRRYLDIGGFPEVVLQSEELRKPTLDQYFNDIIHRDIVRLHGADARKVHLMASYLLVNVGNTVTLSSLRRSIGLSYDAIRDYIAFLEQAGLFHFVREFTFSPKPAPKDLGKLKVYCADTGMARAVQGRHSRDYGRFAENAVCLELVARGAQPGFFRGRKEIDFVVMDPDREVLLLNACMSNDVPDREFEGIREFRSAYPRAGVRPMILTEDREDEVEGVRLLPLWKWMLTDTKDRNDR